MRPFLSGFVVHLPDRDALAVADGRSYEVSPEGVLTLRAGSKEVARFAPGAWVSVQQVGTPLRETWPPPDFDHLIEELGYKLVVGYGFDFRYDTNQFRDPLVNDFNAFVDALVVVEGGISGYDSEYRNWISEAVSAVFGIRPQGSGV